MLIKKTECLDDYGRIWCSSEYDMLDYYEDFCELGIKYNIDKSILDFYLEKLRNQDYDEYDLANLGCHVTNKITDLLLDDWNETVEV